MELCVRGVKDFGSEVCGSLKWVLVPDKLMIYANPPPIVSSKPDWKQPQGHLVLLLICCMTLFKLISFLLILQLWATWAIFFSASPPPTPHRQEE